MVKTHSEARNLPLSVLYFCAGPTLRRSKSMTPTNDVLAVILGGGRGTRLYPLTSVRSKPAVPIAGKYGDRYPPLQLHQPDYFRLPC